MTVLWTEAAHAQLMQIYRYIAQTSPLYATRMVLRITQRGRQLTEYPASGRVVPETGRPEIREVLEPPYRIIYRVRPERVEILAVVHGRRADIGPLPEDGAV